MTDCRANQEQEDGGVRTKFMERRIVCAAIRRKTGHPTIVCGVRHWDRLMLASAFCHDGWEQGFVDNRGDFLTREEAHKVATEAGQITRRCGGDEGRLFSENLY